MRDVRPYLLHETYCRAVSAGATVIDVGCGHGGILKGLIARGCRGIGVDCDTEALEHCRREGLEVLYGFAERLPLEDDCSDAVICNVTLPYTDESAAIAEWARVLKPGGRVLGCFHGFGYPLRQIARGPRVSHRLYGARTVLNSWTYQITGRRLGGWLGDTLYQSKRRLRRHYAIFGLRVVRELLSAKFCGFPMFIFHELEKYGGRR